MLLIQALEFLIHRVEERIRKHLEELSIAVPESAEKALALQLKLQSAQVAQPSFDPRMVQGIQQLQIAEPSLDELKLHFGVTWKELMGKTRDEFEVMLKNALKEKSITINKLLILTRFKRQLKALSEGAYSELSRREKLWYEVAVEAPKGDVPVEELKPDVPVEKPKPVFDFIVDENMIANLAVSAKEAQELAKIATEAGTFEVTIPLISKKMSMHYAGPGRTEVTVKACEEAMKRLFEFCVSQDKLRQKAPHDPAAMVDVFPCTLKDSHVLTGLNQILCEELIERLYLEEEVKAYQHFSMPLPSRLKGYNEQSSEQSRKLICEKLRQFDDKTAKLPESNKTYWLNLFGEIHDLDSRLEPYKSFMPQMLLKITPLSSASGSSGQREISRRLHDLVEVKARAQAIDASQEHRSTCRF
ncbi:hypothetical protein [Candidatus Berkiella aquae]|uniref:Uncharacterized protein n=1 Tax=Candidatus Berkiella aquae TaxID=295108 RepID=A0A0Q9YN95_9GAMM|nr:hypothetical protein [Candidatus Berkiella aquae]MCS5712548.1 hypothetical protein [Candidatus Berkiella aquae]